MAFITNALLDGLRTDFSLQFAAAYEGTEVWYPKLCSEIGSKSKSNTYGWKAQSTTLREWIGARVAQNMTEHEYVLKNKKYEGTVELSRDEIEDDNLGVFQSQTIPDLAEATRKHPDVLLAQVIAANPNGYDGVSFFNTAHPNYNVSGAGVTTFSNDIDKSADSTLDGDVIEAIFSDMAGLIGENGLPLKVRPNLIIVPPQREREALTVMQSTTYAMPKNASAQAATVDNVLRGWAEVLVVPELAGSPNVVYFADCSKAIKPFIYQTRDASELIARQDPSDSKVFDLDLFTYGVRVRHNIGVSLPHLIQRVTLGA